MNCIKEHRFLFWKWKSVEHDYKLKWIYKFMRSSDSFHCIYKCECGASYDKAFVTQDELILQGIPIEVLNQVDTDYTEVKN